MANFVSIGNQTINLDHVCSATYDGHGNVTVALDSGAAIRLSGNDAEEFSQATGKIVETFDKPIPNGLKELSLTYDDAG